MRILKWERRNIWMEGIFYELSEGGVEVRVMKGGGDGVERREEEEEIGRGILIQKIN